MATNQAEIIRELMKRRDQLDPEKAAIVDELAKRFYLSDGQDAPINPGETDTEEKRTLGGFLDNAIASGGRMVGDIATALKHPIDTASNVVKLTSGAIGQLIPGEQVDDKMFQSVVKMYAERYGGWDNFTKTLYEDPVGVLADFSVMAGGAGLAAKGIGVAAKTANLTKTAGMANKIAGIAKSTATVTDPLRMTGQAATAASKLLPAKGKIAARLYESALKPSLGKKNLPKIQGELATGLKEGIVVGQSGLDKLGDLVDDLQNSVKAEIAQGKNQGKVIPAKTVADYLGDTKRKFSEQVNPNSDLREIAKSEREFLNRYAIKDQSGNITGYRDIPVDEAQRLKVGTYRQLKDKAYGEIKGASIEAQKSLARGIKEELAKAIPELADLNARESKLLNLQPVLEHAVARIRNHQLFGIGTPIAGAGVEAVTGNTKMALAAAALRAVIEQPQVKSRIAIAINSARKRAPGKYPTAGPLISRVQEYIDAIRDQEYESVLQVP